MEHFDGPHIDARARAFGSSPILFKGGGAKPPPVNKKMEKMQMDLMAAQLKQAGAKIEMPNFETPPPAPPPPPPPSSSSIDVQEASTDAQKQALRRTGYQKTLFAGETGGFKSQGTLLGGGGATLG